MLWNKVAKLSDVNGILIDVTESKRDGATNPNADVAFIVDLNALNAVDPSKPKRPDWKSRTLIANNISAFNCGFGIHTFRAEHVDIINNTVYGNGTSVGYPDLFPNLSNDIVFLNNIIVPRPGAKLTTKNKDANIRWDYNVYPVDQNVWKGPNDIVADPKFIEVHTDLRKANFRLAKDSPALDSGTDDLGQPTEIDGNKRPASKGRDRGAYEQ